MMKIRAGFISNSSSSSFMSSVCSSFDIASSMIPLRNLFTNNDELLEKIKKLRNIFPSDTNLKFDSCNFNTYIFSHKKGFVIETCNNHPFYELDILSKVDEDDIDGLSNNLEFYDLEGSFFFFKKPLTFNNYCDDHYESLVVISRGKDKGRIVCPICYSKEVPKSTFSEEEKINLHEKLQEAIELATTSDKEKAINIINEIKEKIMEYKNEQ